MIHLSPTWNDWNSKFLNFFAHMSCLFFKKWLKLFQYSNSSSQILWVGWCLYKLLGFRLLWISHIFRFQKNRIFVMVLCWWWEYRQSEKLPLYFIHSRQEHPMGNLYLICLKVGWNISDDVRCGFSKSVIFIFT